MENEQQEQTPQPIQTPNEAQPGNAGTPPQPTENYENKYKDLEREYQTFQKNTADFFNTDPTSYTRFERWWNKQPLEDTPQKAMPFKQDSPKESPDLVSKIKELESKFEERLNPIVEMSSELKANFTRQQMREKNPWLTEDKFKEFEDRLNKAVEDDVKAITDKFPYLRMKPKEAREMALSSLAGLDSDMLLFKFMRDDVLANAGKPRMAPPLAPGMAGKFGNKAGPIPGKMEQLRKAHEAAKSPDEVAELIKRFSDESGYTPTELQKFLHEG